VSYYIRKNHISTFIRKKGPFLTKQWKTNHNQWIHMLLLRGHMTHICARTIYFRKNSMKAWVGDSRLVIQNTLYVIHHQNAALREIRFSERTEQPLKTVTVTSIWQHTSAIASFMNNAGHIYCLFPIHTTSSICLRLPQCSQWQNSKLSSSCWTKGCTVTMLKMMITRQEMTCLRILKCEWYIYGWFCYEICT